MDIILELPQGEQANLTLHPEDSLEDLRHQIAQEHPYPFFQLHRGGRSVDLQDIKELQQGDRLRLLPHYPPLVNWETLLASLAIFPQHVAEQVERFSIPGVVTKYDKISGTRYSSLDEPPDYSDLIEKIKRQSWSKPEQFRYDYRSYLGLKDSVPQLRDDSDCSCQEYDGSQGTEIREIRWRGNGLHDVVRIIKLGQTIICGIQVEDQYFALGLKEDTRIWSMDSSIGFDGIERWGWGFYKGDPIVTCQEIVQGYGDYDREGYLISHYKSAYPRLPFLPEDDLTEIQDVSEMALALIQAYLDGFRRRRA